jgi:hypothetical protein
MGISLLQEVVINLGTMINPTISIDNSIKALEKEIEAKGGEEKKICSKYLKKSKIALVQVTVSRKSQAYGIESLVT